MSAPQVDQLLDHLRALKNGRARDSFFRSREFIQSAGRLYTPAVLVQEPQGYKIMDGNHRVAALFSLNASRQLHVDAWIGN